MFKVDQIDHVELFVPDRYEAAAWYERVLGLRVVPEAEHWATENGPLMISSDNGNTKLALLHGEPVESPRQAAFRRVAFRVSAEGFAAYSIYFSDPHGHQLEVTTYDYDETREFLLHTSA